MFRFILQAASIQDGAWFLSVLIVFHRLNGDHIGCILVAKIGPWDH